MSDIYVQYEATVSVTHSVWRIIVKVPRGKIDQYRIDHDDQSSDDTKIKRDAKSRHVSLRDYCQDEIIGSMVLAEFE
jgi:hypothetical protein